MPAAMVRFAKKFFVVVGTAGALIVNLSLLAVFVVVTVVFAYTLGWLSFAGHALVLFLIAGLVAFAIIGFAEHAK